MVQIAQIASDLLAQQVSAALRAYAGPGKPLTQEALAVACGLDPRTVRAHFGGETAPSLPAMLAYMQVLPVPFANEVLALANLGGCRRIADDGNPHATLATLAVGVQHLAEALADGHVDHQESRLLQPHLRQAAADCERLIAALKERYGC